MALYSKLDVVNRGLSLIGQLPVNDIETQHPAVPGILIHLDFATKQVQSRKWWFNYERTTLHPQPNGEILVPNDVASVDACDKRLVVSQRGRRLYNNHAGTYIFDAVVEVYLHRVVDFDDLPPTAAHYAMTQALMTMQAGLDGDGVRYRDLATEDAKALDALTSESTRNTQANLLHRRGVQTAMHRINQNTPFQFRR